MEKMNILSASMESDGRDYHGNVNHNFVTMIVFSIMIVLALIGAFSIITWLFVKEK